MNSRAVPGIPAGALAACACGACAAAIALAPAWTTKAALAIPLALGIAVWWSLRDRAWWVRAFLLAAVLLPPLPVELGNSGPHPALAIAAIGGFVSLVWLRDWTFRPDSLTWSLVTLGFAMALSLAPAALYSGPSPALASLGRVMLFSITPFLFGYVSSGPGRGAFSAPLHDVRRLYWAAVAAALFACLDFHFQWPPPAGFGAQYVWLDSGVYRRAQGLFYEASTLGNFCAFFLVMIAVSLAEPARSRPLGRVALASGGALLLAALLVSYSRGSVVCLLVALIVLGWLHRRRLSSVRLAVVAAAGLPLALWQIWKVFPRFTEMYWFRLSASAEYFFSSTDGVLSGRVGSWRVLLDWISSHPWQLLFGVGYKTLPYTALLGRPVVADNMYLSLLIETGILGLAALVCLNIAVLAAARASSRSSDPARAFLGKWMFCFWAGQSMQMLSGDLLTYWRVLPVYFFVLALAVRP